MVETTRLAPSPTGALHLGNARTFLINWAMARQRGWRIVLRIEDLDTPRTKPGADQQAIDDLCWLGIDWDQGPHYQADDLSPYAAALGRLHDQGLIYPCVCTRKDIEQAASAPHANKHEQHYPGTCRPRCWGGAGDAPPADAAPLDDPCPDRPAAWRVFVPDESIVFDDGLLGRQVVDVQGKIGDFVVVSKARLPAYQLAVCIDDQRQAVTHIVRGKDLVRSAGRQRYLYSVLGLAPLPQYWHLPLVLGPDGRRLAKRHGDTRVSWYREQAVSAERIIGLMGHWCGLIDEPRPMGGAEFVDRFDLAALPKTDITFTAKDHAWLVNG